MGGETKKIRDNVGIPKFLSLDEYVTDDVTRPPEWKCSMPSQCTLTNCGESVQPERLSAPSSSSPAPSQPSPTTTAATAATADPIRSPSPAQPSSSQAAAEAGPSSAVLMPPEKAPPPAPAVLNSQSDQKPKRTPEDEDLLLKLQQHGVDTAWFEAYLQNHAQSVSFTGVSGSRQISTALPNNMGVFQGSALGPLLYTIFSNDLSLFVPGATVVQYADDTQVMVCGNKTALSDLIERMEQALSSLDLWFRANSLKVNPDKTQLIVFGSRQNLRNVPPFGVKFRERTIQPVLEVKNLGVIFDRHLSWDAHIQEITRKCFGILIGLSHIRHYLPAEILPTIVIALVLSRVRYCLPVYGNGSRQNLNKIQKVLNFAARVISGRRKFSRSADVRAALGWLDAEDLFKYRVSGKKVYPINLE